MEKLECFVDVSLYLCRQNLILDHLDNKLLGEIQINRLKF